MISNEYVENVRVDTQVYFRYAAILFIRWIIMNLHLMVINHFFIDTEIYLLFFFFLYLVYIIIRTLYDRSLAAAWQK